ncbi:EF-P 5-aminopentanol modification-associated protein YfmF [Alkalicoccobacillus porphyridii]|uniref:Insulinase family protein n=1 Tax=Alkalicoccobacillus porphyridii TaxID=2597270 RepID=A0A553ZYF7_9BACI|nr:pitrilysin family protein [Alkalicoccobacillus porphyridii]TSB46464.1 insulinase family protein [Alkalicoccobacillus porphyridii]
MEQKDQQFSHQGIRVHVMKTDKYKTTTFMVMLRAPLEKDTVSKRALLPHVLQGGTKQWPTRQKLRVHLDDLYGARLSGDVRKSGEQHVISFFMDVANERYLKEKTSLLGNALDVLSDVLLHPFTENNGFAKDVVESEKRTLKQRIESVYDDKMRYANMRATEVMCKGEPYAIPAFGDKESVDAITAQDLYDYYQSILKTDGIDLYVVGDVDEKQVSEQVHSLFQLSQPAPQKQVSVPAPVAVDEVKVVHENQDIKQGKLNMGFRTHTQYGDSDYAAMQVFNGLYGGFTHSKLFVNVREKESLAYYAASRLESHKGILMVMAGIEFEKYDRAVEIINEQFEKMKQGDFTESEIDQTKSMLRNQLLEAADSASGQIELNYRQQLSAADDTVEDLLKQIEQVSKEDIIQAGKKCELDTIYFLKGGSKHEPDAV